MIAGISPNRQVESLPELARHLRALDHDGGVGLEGWSWACLTRHDFAAVGAALEGLAQRINATDEPHAKARLVEVRERLRDCLEQAWHEAASCCAGSGD